MHRHDGRLLRPPDVSPTTTATTRCSGAARCCTGRCRASTPTARRPSTRSRSPSARCSSLVGDDADRLMVARDVRVVRRPRRRALPPRARRRSRRVVGARRRGAARARASTSRSSPPAAYIDIPYLAFVVWAAALEAGRPRRGTPVFVLLAARRAAAPGGVAAERACTGCGASLPRDLAAAHQLRGAGRDRPGRLARRRLDRHRRPAVLAAPTRPAWPRSSGRTRGLSEIPAATVAVPAEPRQGAGLLRGHPRARPGDRARPAARLVAARDVRDRAWGRSCSSALAGLSVIDRYLLVPSLMVMLFAAVDARRLDDAAPRGGCGPRGRSARPRCSSPTARSSRRRACSFSTVRHRARVPRPVARRARGALPQPEGARGAEVRAGVGRRTTSSIPDTRWVARRWRRTT